MTVPYSKRVTEAGVGVFLKLLARWKGSIYRIVWVELIWYLILYYALNTLYTYGLDEYGKKNFSYLVSHFSKYGNAIPLSFVLGFYVSLVYDRWWSQYNTLPYPDDIAILVSAGIYGQEDKARMVRRSIVRYVCAAFTITLSMMSPKVKKRFPTYNHFVQAGLLSNQEKKMIEELDREYPSYKKYWLPLAWAANTASKARSDGLIEDEMALKDILEKITEFREKCKKLSDYDWICVPLVYTQVVTLAVYLYFLFTSIGTQRVDEEGVDGYSWIYKFPLMSCVEFFFYMGWLKVAESLINPFGSDDDDFEVNWMIDRHLQVGYLLVDKIHNEPPKLTKDIYWDQTAPNQLPFTVATQKYMFERPEESTSRITVKRNDQDLVFKDDVGGLQESSVLFKGKSIAKLFRRRNPNPGYALRKVALRSDQQESEWEELNKYEQEDTNDKNEDNNFPNDGTMSDLQKGEREAHV